MFINSLGFPTYEAKDMGLGELQFKEYDPDLIIHVVGPEQTSYFQVVFKALELIFPKTKGKEYHRAYGWVRLKKGKMSSRKGEVVTGESLLDEAKRYLHHPSSPKRLRINFRNATNTVPLSLAIFRSPH